jgi:hypothetical protein
MELIVQKKKDPMKHISILVPKIAILEALKAPVSYSLR